MTESFEHYASKYYDPVKAHEYYMKTRHLKGYDTQGKTLNDEGKQAKAYITKTNPRGTLFGSQEGTE